MDDEKTTTGPEPGLPADEPIASDVTEEVPATGDVAPVDTATAPEVAEPESAPAEEPAPVPAEVAEEPAPDPASEQLSLDEMVGSLKDTGAVEETAEAEVEAEVEAETPAEVEDAAEDVSDEVATVPVAAEAPQGGVPARARLAARSPFWILAGVWAVFAGVMTYLLWADAAKPFTSSPLYAGLTFGGIGLTAAGPLLGVVAWLLLRRAGPELRGGLVRALLLRAAVATLSGNLMWWAGLIALDLHRVGAL